MKIIADITPVPLARNKHKIDSVKPFLPKRSRLFRENLQWILRAAMKGKEIFSGALSVKINLYKNCAITSRHYGDADNHAKSILDACNGIVFVDDAQIVNLQVVKNKSVEQRLVIEVENAD